MHHYQAQGFQLLKRHWKSPFAEIDLVLRSAQNELLLVEVKSVISFEYLHIRLTQKQKNRLKRALLFSIEKDPTARMELAVVSQQGAILIFNDIFS